MKSFSVPAFVNIKKFEDEFSETKSLFVQVDGLIDFNTVIDKLEKLETRLKEIKSLVYIANINQKGQ